MSVNINRMIHLRGDEVWLQNGDDNDKYDIYQKYGDEIRSIIFYREFRHEIIVLPKNHNILYRSVFWLTNSVFRAIGRDLYGLTRTDYLQMFCINDNGEDYYKYYDCQTEPLHTAVKKQDLQRLENLLTNTIVNKNCRNRLGETLILQALKGEVHVGILNMLLDYGCDCTTGSSKGLTPLHIAVLDNNINLIREFINRGANVNMISNCGLTPLLLGVLASRYEAVCELLNSNANPKLVTPFEFTPLMLALLFPEIDNRICELLYSYDIHTATRFGNPVYCAILSGHSFAQKLILEGADVNYVASFGNLEQSCIVKAVNDVQLFKLVWTKLDHNIFSEKLVHFLEYMDVEKVHEAGKSHLVDVIIKIFTSPNALLLCKSHYENYEESFFDKFLNFKFVTGDDLCNIISVMPCAFYEDIVRLYQQFKFDGKLEFLLQLYEYIPPCKVHSLRATLLANYICFNSIQISKYFWEECDLNEVFYFLNYFTPNSTFRIKFHNEFSHTTDMEYSIYKLCEEKLAARSVPSLQELSRDKLRELIFRGNKKPYKEINNLPIPQMIKDILYLKREIYS